MKKLIAGLLAATMLLPNGMMAGTIDAQSKEPPVTTDTAARPEKLKASALDTIESNEQISPDEKVTVIVVLEKSTNPLAIFQQKTVQNEISKKVLDGEKLEVLHSYTNVENGFAAVVPYGKLDEIRELSSVKTAYLAPVFKVAPDQDVKLTELGGLENSSGYQGEGMVIAILDTGLEINHKSFKDAPNSPALTQKDIENVLATKDLKAEEKKAGITASQVYHTAKVPFAFDYADNDLDVTPGSAGDHGVHVSGIAAANSGVVDDVVGVAPQAQILAMKVFSSSGSNGATWDDILAAADDAVALGADVINMSLGSTCGFSTPEGDEEVAKVFQKIADSGVMLSISAGNEYSSALGTRIGKGHALTQNPDYGTVASPSSYSEPLSIASVEKADTIDSCYLTVGDRKVAFNDTVEDSTASGVDANSKSFRSLAGKELSYVVVPNAGETADYEGLDVKGKIALVSRGSVEYNVKKEAAKAAGAAGILVYNNEPGMLYMQMDAYDLPSAFISQADGKALAALAENARKLTVSASYGKVDNPTSGEMSDFSSWGVTPELTLKPDITAPGGNIKSTTVNNGYTTKSGTSMSAPFVSGAMAVVKQYIEQNKLADSETDKAALTDNLLMSTADLVMAGTAPYSPRKQGAGSVNLTAATSTKAYLTDVDGNRPKIALGDDVNKSGKYTVKFKVHNLSEDTLTYTLGGYIQADAKEVTKKLGDADVNQVTELPYLLGKIDAQTVTVAGGATETVSVTVSLTQANKDYLNSFENGTYVEGFVTLTPQSETQPILSIPYMGFYGDWTQAPIVDATDYGDELNGKENWSQAYTNTAASSSLEGTVNTYLGDNPYHDGVAYSSDRNAISPNGDDYMDSLSFVYTGLLRNVKSLKYEIKDATTNEVYYSKDMEYETKSVYDSNYYQIVPSGVSDYSKFEAWSGTKKDGYSKLANNTKAIVTISGELSYDQHASKNKRSSWSFPITIDTEEPEAKDITVRTENGKYYVDMTVSDNQFVSNVTISNNAESKELASYAVTEDKAGAETKCTYDITGFGENLKVVVNDYACNRKVYSIKAEGNTDASEVIVPTKSIFKEDFEETSFPPEGWSIKSTVADKTWYQGTEYGSKMAMVDLSKTDQQNEWLITPAINLKEQSTKASMIFDFYTNYYWSVQNHHHNLKVMASADNGANWEQIWQLWDWNAKNEFGTWEKTQAKVTIPDKYQDAQSVKFAFVYEGKDSTSLWLDNVQVYVEDPSQIHTITAKAGEGGSIDPSGAVQITDGKSKTFTITPDEGYFLSDVKVDGESIGPKSSYTFTNVKEDHSITAEFTSRTGGEKTVLLEEDFENCTANGAFPDGWTVEKTNSNSTWTVYKYYYADNTLTASCGDDYTSYAKQDERLITPVLDMSNGGGAVSFRYIGGKTPTISGDYTVKLEASKDGSTWTTLWTSTELKNATYDEIGYSGNTLSANVAVNIPAELQGSTTKLAFRYERPAGENSGRGAVDDIRIMANQTSSGDDTESTLLDENFDESVGKLPTNWTQKVNNTAYAATWKIYKRSADHIGATCSADTDSLEDYGKGQNEFLVTPALNLTGKNATMTFEFSGQTSGLSKTLTSNKTTVTLEATDDDGKTWTEIWNAADETLTAGTIDGLQTVNASVAIPESFQKDNVKFAFRYQTKVGMTSGGCTAFIDNVKLTASGGSSEPDKTTFTITASAGQGGSISPNGSVSVAKGADQKFTITPSEGYEIADVKVDNESVGKKTEYTFEKVGENHTIAATFTEKAVVLPDSIHEDFNNSEELPTGWSVEGPSSKYYETWKIGKYTALNRGNVALCTQNVMFAQEQNEKLILPQINMKSNMALSFDFGGSYAELSSGSIQFTVKATKDKGQTWTAIWNAKDHLPAVDEDSSVEDITGKGNVALPSNFCVDGAQFAFVFESSDRRNGTVAVDNVDLATSSTPAPNMYGITIAPMKNGTVTANKTVAAADDTITLTVKPDAGYHLKDGTLMANDQVVSGNTFTMPTKEVTITATFEKDKDASEPGKYKDGTYEGAAQGNNGAVSVTVTVVNGNISKIEVTDQKETDSFWKDAIAIIENLIGLGDDEAVSKVDTVSGATNSSRAIKEAVQNALKNAIADDSGIFDSGNGSQKTPYKICTIAQLQAFAKSVNDGTDYKGKYVSLGASLNLKDVAWEPIGTSDQGKYTGFSGTFDGCGYTVGHINCGSGSAAADYEAIGFFGVVDGTVQNLNISIDKYYNSHDAGNQIVSMGGLVGILARGGVIDHCSVSGGTQVVSETSGPKTAVGGLVGQMEFRTVVANSWTDVGLSYGSLDTDADVSMGGICGKQAQNSLIANSASFGPVPGMIMTGALRVGGLAGQTSGAIYNCYTTGLTKANVMGQYTANGFVNNDASTAIGHLIGSSTIGAALYDCYYDKNADQFSNVDLAGDPSEGKTERRQATGWENGSETKTDETFVEGKTASELASAEFASTLNTNKKNTTKDAATDYFTEKKLLDNKISVLEDQLDNSFYNWKLTDGRVLFGDTAIATTDIESVELLEQKTVAYGTAKANLNLPETVQVTLSDKTKKNLKVTWSCDKYDGNTAGDYTFEGTLTPTGGIQNTNDHKAYIVVKVQAKSSEESRSITAVAAQTGKTVAYGTAKADLNLPKTVQVTLDNGNTKELAVTWSCDKYDGNTAGTYTFTGALTLTDGLTNPKNLTASIAVTVKAKSSGGSGGGGGSSSGSKVQKPTITVGNGGSVDKSTDGTTITIRPDTGYTIADITVNGTSKGKTDKVTGLKTGDKVTITFEKTQTAPETPAFNDIENHWAKNEIEKAAKRGLFSGTSANTFSPNALTNRGMLVTVLYRLENEPAVKGGSQFTDVTADAWYSKAMAWASENGIVTGYGDGKFGPNDTITREQLASILHRYAKYKGYDVTKTADLSAYTDDSTISGWATGAMKWANAEKLLNGRTQTTLAPKGTATRAEVAKVLVTFVENVEK